MGKGFTLIKRLPLMLSVVLSVLVMHCHAVQAETVQALSTDPIEHVYFWRSGMSEGRKPYETELIELVLSLSDDKYGPAELVVSEREMSAVRGREQLSIGKGVDIITSPLYSEELKHAEDQGTIILPYDILRNLLGYRRLIVRSEDKAKFESLNSFEDLGVMVCAQGRDWPDASIYQHAQLNVVFSESYLSLFPMLAYDRFDYLPLGAGEIEASLAANNVLGDHLSIADNLVIYYAWPVRILVNQHKKHLAERIDYGYQAALKSGALDALFERHFGKVIERLNSSDIKVFVLENPLSNPSEKAPSPSLTANAQILHDYRQPHELVPLHN
ncbi:MAG: hypothetical protein ACI93R_000717 [Flavobacteriales bacterium]